jgi:hypothetical protein
MRPDNCKRWITDVGGTADGTAELGWITPEPNSNGSHERKVDRPESKKGRLGDKVPDMFDDVPDALDTTVLSALVPTVLLPTRQLHERFTKNIIPCAPAGLNRIAIFASVVDIENEPNTRVGVIHPAQIEDDGGVVIGDSLVASSAFGQDGGGNENGEGDRKHAEGLVCDASQLDPGNLSVPEMRDDWCKAQEILSVDSNANADARDIWVGGNALVGHGGEMQSACVGLGNVAAACLLLRSTIETYSRCPPLSREHENDSRYSSILSQSLAISAPFKHQRCHYTVVEGKRLRNVCHSRIATLSRFYPSHNQFIHRSWQLPIERRASPLLDDDTGSLENRRQRLLTVQS